jgi:hypothetical protein
MSAPAKCPLCGTKLQPDWESCPNCPMSFQDAPPEKSALQNDTFRSFGIPLLFFGALAYFVWAGGQYLWRTAEEGTKSTVAATKTTLANAGKPVDGTVAQALVEQLKTNRDEPGAASPGEGAEPRPQEEEGPGIVSVMPEKGPRPKAVTEWKMRGVIYDLLTLKPIPGVHMIFTDNETNSRAQIQSDAQGRYRAILPALAGRGYLVTLSKPGYLKSYLNPGTEGVADMTLERRTEIVKELSSLISEPAVLEPNSDRPLVTDFHMAPQ